MNNLHNPISVSSDPPFFDLFRQHSVKFCYTARLTEISIQEIMNTRLTCTHIDDYDGNGSDGGAAYPIDFSISRTFIKNSFGWFRCENVFAFKIKCVWFISFWLRLCLLCPCQTGYVVFIVSTNQANACQRSCKHFWVENMRLTQFRCGKRVFGPSSSAWEKACWHWLIWVERHRERKSPFSPLIPMQI